MEELPTTAFENWTRPKILLTDNQLFIKDTLIMWRLFLFLVGVFFVTFAVLFKVGSDQTKGVLFGLLWSIVFLYDALSLKRVRIDLKEKKIYRRSVNPIENLLDLILQHPAVVPFENVDCFFSDYPEAVASAVRRYYVYLKTTDPYSLKIGTFRTKAESDQFAEFLNRKVPRGVNHGRVTRK